MASVFIMKCLQIGSPASSYLANWELSEEDFLNECLFNCSSQSQFLYLACTNMHEIDRRQKYMLEFVK
jgi:hypothetical protein